MALAARFYPEARRALRTDGMTSEQIAALPVGQVIAIAAARAYQHIADEYEKWWHLPFWQARARWGQAEEQLRAEGYLCGPLRGREIIPLASLLLPGTSNARISQVRLQRELAALQVIEAIRMHAAVHRGQLPQTLAAITTVPVPLNPATGQPFQYTRQADTAVLELPKSDGLKAAQRYEITICND
jgi:hypothetical protein